MAMEGFCVFASKAALALLLVNGFMLLVVERGSAEWVLTVLSVVMMAVLFAASMAMLHRQCKKDDEWNKN